MALLNDTDMKLRALVGTVWDGAEVVEAKNTTGGGVKLTFGSARLSRNKTDRLRERTVRGHIGPCHAPHRPWNNMSKVAAGSLDEEDYAIAEAVSLSARGSIKTDNMRKQIERLSRHGSPRIRILVNGRHVGTNSFLPSYETVYDGSMDGFVIAYDADVPKERRSILDLKEKTEMGNETRVFRVTAVNTQTKEVLVDATTIIAADKDQATTTIIAELVEDTDSGVSSKNAHHVKVYAELLGTIPVE